MKGMGWVLIIPGIMKSLNAAIDSAQLKIFMGKQMHTGGGVGNVSAITRKARKTMPISDEVIKEEEIYKAREELAKALADAEAATFAVLQAQADLDKLLEVEDGE